jgi:hypothetical protein
VDLRPELIPPILDEEKVARLAKIAGRLDDFGDRERGQELVEQFNREAGTSFAYQDFQGIYGSMDADVWVRMNLVGRSVKVIPDITNEELLEMIRRVRAVSEWEEHESGFWLEMLEVNLSPDIVTMIYYPGDYLGDGDNTQDLSEKQILDIALAAKKKQAEWTGG